MHIIHTSKFESYLQTTTPDTAVTFHIFHCLSIFNVHSILEVGLIPSIIHCVILKNNKSFVVFIFNVIAAAEPES